MIAQKLEIFEFGARIGQGLIDRRAIRGDRHDHSPEDQVASSGYVPTG
jgi:hypothetical protein